MVKELWRKLTALTRREEIAGELLEEMRAHVEMKASDTGDRHAAQRTFGNTTMLLEDSNSVWGWPRLEDWLRDFRYAIRGQIRRPAFAATVVFTLALGMGATSTIFSLIDTVLLRPLPYPKAARLVAVQEMKPGENEMRTPVSPGRLTDWQRLNRTFVALAGSYGDMLTDDSGAVPERLDTAFVSPGFFTVLDTTPALGRTFTAEEERAGGATAVVISDGFWKRRFASDRGVLGRSLRLMETNYIIVGVMPPSFQCPTPATELWVPRQAGPAMLQMREARFYSCVGLLKSGVTLEQARFDLSAVQQRLGEQYPTTDAGWSIALDPLREELVGRVRAGLWLLLGSVSVLLAITCANVACLLLARLNSRVAEIATRCSLGAGRAAIGRQLFAEGLVYALAGGSVGLAIALAGINVLRTQLADLPRITELTVDARLLGAVVAISVVAAVLFSLVPILQTFRCDLAGLIIRGGRGVAGSRQRLPRILVCGQFGLAAALLIGAGLFLRSLANLEETPLGFHYDNVLTMRISASSNEAPSQTVQRQQRILQVLAALPGVTAVSMTSGLPGASPAWPREFEIEGEASPGGKLRFAMWRIVTAEYFQTVGIPFLSGRTCRMNSDPRTPFETLVNRSFADRYFTGRDPIGHAILKGPQGNTPAMVVGVVADARENGYNVPPQPMIYACGFLRYWPNSDFLIQARNPSFLSNPAREMIQAIEPARAVYAVRPLSQALADALSQVRFRAIVVSLFSLLALTLAAIGLYGVMAYMVSQRTREIGVRVALGARPVQIVGSMLQSAGVLAGAGIAIGIALAAGAFQMLGALLYGVNSFDAGTYLTAIGVLLGVALAATLIPSRRALSIDPMRALRES
ncbi:MAG TPA: ABC transporter permease [Bryobacteraceae bacterium]|nr:ABC transporter permease [Bryobacteraceae bacterium]